MAESYYILMYKIEIPKTHFSLKYIRNFNTKENGNMEPLPQYNKSLTVYSLPNLI